MKTDDVNDTLRTEGADAVRGRLDEACKVKGASTLDQVITVFDKWLVLHDKTPVYAALGTVAANLLPGDPVWLGIIAPPSSAKTEIINALSGLSFVEPVATLTPAALLSGTPKRQRDKTARGGLLNKIGEFGVLCWKDFGSLLSMRPEAKAEMLAALRELYDGAWTRHLGTDGGQTLSWSGKLGLVFGATEAYDDHYAVIGSLGDRFLLCRLASSYGGQLRKALDHTGRKNKLMRDELADVVAELFANKLHEPSPLSDAEIQRLDDIVSLAVRLRAHVTRDRYSREIESIHGAEGPGRLGLSLERLFAGLCAIGLTRDKGMRIVEDVALASTPPIRRHAFELLTETPITTRNIARALKLPTTTARRALEDLTAQGLAARSRAKNCDGEEKEGGADLWSLDEEWTSWPAKWAATSNHNQNADAGGTRDVASNDPPNDVPTSSNGPEKASNDSEKDPVDAGLARVLGEWKAAFGIGRTITIDELVGVDHKGLNAALLVVAAMDDGRTVSNIRLARWLRYFNEVSVNRLLLRYGGVNSEGSQLWTLQDAAHALT